MAFTRLPDMTPTEIQHLFAYTEWANAHVLDAAEQLPAQQLLSDVRISHTSILGTLLHMASAEWIWLERWHGHSPQGADAYAGWEPGDAVSVAQVREKWQPIIQKRQAYLAGLGEGDLSRELPFRRFNGDLYALPLVQQMLHVVNHATLHRGQVVGMIRQLGIVPPSTDLLFYLIQTGSAGAHASLGR